MVHRCSASAVRAHTPEIKLLTSYSNHTQSACTFTCTVRLICAFLNVILSAQIILVEKANYNVTTDSTMMIKVRAADGFLMIRLIVELRQERRGLKPV